MCRRIYYLVSPPTAAANAAYAFVHYLSASVPALQPRRRRARPSAGVAVAGAEGGGSAFDGRGELHLAWLPPMPMLPNAAAMVVPPTASAALLAVASDDWFNDSEMVFDFGEAGAARWWRGGG